ncbi:MAG: hypothetical protein AB7Q42_13980 [Acidimicrobiia bacterium]
MPLAEDGVLGLAPLDPGAAAPSELDDDGPPEPIAGDMTVVTITLPVLASTLAPTTSEGVRWRDTFTESA